MASHEELLGEMPKLEKLSNAARLKHAKKRRQKQLKKWQEWLRVERATNGTSQRRTCQPQIGFQQEAVLNDLVARNDIIGGKRRQLEVFLEVRWAWPHRTQPNLAGKGRVRAVAFGLQTSIFGNSANSSPVTRWC